MKKSIYLILCLTSFSSYSQFEKGKYSIGVNYSHNYVLPEIKGAQGAWSSIIGVPTAGYFLKENILLGLDVNLQFAPKNIRQLTDRPGILGSLSPFLRLYKKTTSNIIPFVQLSPKFGKKFKEEKAIFIDNSGVIGTAGFKENMFGVQINTGVSFKLSRIVFFDTSIYLDRVVSTRKMVTTGKLANVSPAGKTSDSYSNIGIMGGFKILM